MREEAEIMRIGYKYRRILRSGVVSLPYKDAVRIIGPDCAYHLYQDEHKKRKDIPGSPNREPQQKP